MSRINIKEPNRGGGGGGGGRVCFKCQGFGHIAKDCRNPGTVDPGYNNSGGYRSRGGFGQPHQGMPVYTANPPYPPPGWTGAQNNPTPEYVSNQPQQSYPDPNPKEVPANMQQAQSADGSHWSVQERQSQSGGTGISESGQSDGSHSGIKDGSKSHKRERSHSGGRQNEPQSTTTDKAKSDPRSRSNSAGKHRSHSGGRSHGNDGQQNPDKQSTRWGPEHHRNDQRQQGHGGYPPAYARGYNDSYNNDSQQYQNQQPDWNNSGNSYRQPRQQRGRDDDGTVFLSKQLSSILRHNAERFGLKLMKGGFIYVDDIFNKVHKLRGYNYDDIHYVVDNNDKNRFTLETEANGKLKIRANQGHSIEVEELDLKPILSADEYPRVIHGTYYASWETIKRTGMRRMKRNHMHFAAGEPGQDGVISGMRSSCEVMIYIDMEKALKDGLKFYLSSNNVILCPGNDDGYLFPCYFLGVKDRQTGHRIEYDYSISSLKRSSGPGKSEAGQEFNKSKKKKNKKNKEDLEVKPEDGKPGQKKDKASTKQDDGDENFQDASEMFSEVAEVPDQWEDAQADEPKGKVKEESNKPKDARDAGPKRGAPADKGAEETANKKDPLPWTTTPTKLADVELSKSAVEYIQKQLSPSNVAVCCCGNGLGTEGSDITMIVVLARPEIYVYHFQDGQKQLMTEGGLKDLLMSKDCKKIFHNIGSVSLSLIQEFDILLNGVPITDIGVLFDKSSVPEMEREKLEEKYGLKHAEMKKHIRSWEKENDELVKKLTSPDTIQEAINTLVERGKLMLELHDICASVMSVEMERALKKEVYKLAVPEKDCFLAEKIAELKVAGKKKANKPKAPVEPEQAQAQGKKKSGGKKNKKK